MATDINGKRNQKNNIQLGKTAKKEKRMKFALGLLYLFHVQMLSSMERT